MTTFNLEPPPAWSDLDAETQVRAVESFKALAAGITIVTEANGDTHSCRQQADGTFLFVAHTPMHVVKVTWMSMHANCDLQLIIGDSITFTPKITYV